MLLPPMLAAIVGVMVIGHFLVNLTPPARCAMDKEDRDFPGRESSFSQICASGSGQVRVRVIENQHPIV